MKLSYNAVWEDALALVRAYFPLALAIAGVFMFLPSLLVSYFLPQPETGGEPSAQQQAMVGYFVQNWPWLALAIAVTVVGTLAILALVLDARRPSVGEAILRGGTATPIYLGAMVIVGIGLFLAAFVVSLLLSLFVAVGGTAVATLAGLIILILLFYGSGRLFPLPCVLVGEEERNPIKAIARSLALTRGRGWAIAGLLILILLALAVLGLGVGLAAGTLFRLFLNEPLAIFLSLIVNNAVNAAAAAFLTLLSAALYRHLSGRGSAAAFD